MTSTLINCIITAGPALVALRCGAGAVIAERYRRCAESDDHDATTPAPAAEPLTIASPMPADGASRFPVLQLQWGQRGATVDVVVARGAAELALSPMTRRGLWTVMQFDHETDEAAHRKTN